jgi:hypothetical protein
MLPMPMSGWVELFDLDGESKGSIGRKGGVPCTLGFPVAAALTNSGEMLVVDRQRMVLNRWSVENNKCLGESLGIGSRPGQVYYPVDLALDPAGRVYVAQGFEGRVQVFEGADPATRIERSDLEPVP